jgi:hypothetical protein
MTHGLRRLALIGVLALAVGGPGLAGAAHSAATVSAGAPTASPPGGPVPVGFRIADLSFVGTHEGWALGTAPCTHKPCTSVLRTTDGGASWVGIPAPIASLTACTHACVSGLRFANPDVGYAFRSSLEMTTDGGSTWHKQSGNAIALGITGDTVIRVRANHPSGCPPGCTFRLQAASVGSTTWHNLPAPHVVGDFPDVEAAGASVIVTVEQNPAGGAQDAHATLLLSANHGRTWRKRADPCGHRVAGEDDTVSVAVTTHRRAAVLCRPRRGNAGHDFVLTSSNGGRTFGAPHAIAAAGGKHAAYLVARTGHALFVATVTGTGSEAHYNVDVSRNGGHTWTSALRTTGPSGSAGIDGFLGFESASVGHFVGNRRTVSRTADAGRTWATHHFAR